MIEIIKNVGEFTLRKVTSKNEIGGRIYTGTSYEIWNDTEKMKQGIHGEDGCIYCRGFAGTPENEVIEIFDTSELNQSKEEITENVEGPKGWTHEDMISQGG